jgi:hypothetical protein
VQFRYPEQPVKSRSWWLLVEPEQPVDLCSVEPGFEVDLYVTADLRTMTAIWMGQDTVLSALGSQRLVLSGDRVLSENMQTWLGLSPFSKTQKMVA